MEHEIIIKCSTDDLENILSCITVDCPWCSNVDIAYSVP